MSQMSTEPSPDTVYLKGGSLTDLIHETSPRVLSGLLVGGVGGASRSVKWTENYGFPVSLRFCHHNKYISGIIFEYKPRSTASSSSTSIFEAFGNTKNATASQDVFTLSPGEYISEVVVFNNEFIIAIRLFTTFGRQHLSNSQHKQGSGELRNIRRTHMVIPKDYGLVQISGRSGEWIDAVSLAYAPILFPPSTFSTVYGNTFSPAQPLPAPELPSDKIIISPLVGNMTVTRSKVAWQPHQGPVVMVAVHKLKQTVTHLSVVSVTNETNIYGIKPVTATGLSPPGTVSYMIRIDPYAFQGFIVRYNHLGLIADILEKKPNENIPGRTVVVEKPYDLIGFLCYSCPVIGEDFTGIAGFQLLLHPSNPTDPRILYPNVRPARRTQG